MKPSRLVTKATLLGTAALAAAAVSLVGAAALVIGPGVAKAETHGSMGDHDPYAFAMELATDSLSPVTVDQARSLAINVCITRSSDGVSEQDLIHAMEATKSIDLAVDTVMGAEWHFCPAYATAFNQSSVTTPNDGL
jgi:hypothetical protein